MVTVNERSTAYVRARFLDSDGTVVTPSAVTYRIDCLTTKTLIRASTPVPPAGEIELVISPEENRIINERNVRELRRVTVVAQYGGGADQVTGEFDYEVRDLGPGVGTG